MQIRPFCRHNGAQQIIVSSQRDGFHPRAAWMRMEAVLNSYVVPGGCRHCARLVVPPRWGLSAFVQMSGGGMKRDGSPELAEAEVEEAKRPSPGEM